MKTISDEIKCSKFSKESGIHIPGKLCSGSGLNKGDSRTPADGAGRTEEEDDEGLFLCSTALVTRKGGLSHNPSAAAAGLDFRQ